jgi:hypothetical protein
VLAAPFAEEIKAVSPAIGRPPTSPSLRLAAPNLAKVAQNRSVRMALADTFSVLGLWMESAMPTEDETASYLDDVSGVRQIDGM